MGGKAATAATAVGKLQGLLGKAAAVTGSLGVGLGVGTTLEELVFDPQRKDYEKTSAAIDRTINQASKTAWGSDTGAKQTQLKALALAQKTMASGDFDMPVTDRLIEDAKENLSKLGLGERSSFYVDWEMKAAGITKAREQLLKSIEEDAKKYLEGSLFAVNPPLTKEQQAEKYLEGTMLGKNTTTVSKEIVEIKFTNKPEGVEVKRSGKRRTGLNTGIVMQP
jgi:hypothetical protein